MTRKPATDYFADDEFETTHTDEPEPSTCSVGKPSVLRGTDHD